MSHERVLRSGLKILGSLASGTGDPMLTLDSTSKDVGSIPSIDLSTYLSTSLTSTYVYVGNSSNTATGVALSGAITITDTGVVSVAPAVITNTEISSIAAIDYSKLNLAGGIVNGDISTSASIDRSKLATGNTYRVLVNNNLGLLTEALAITPNMLLLSDINGLPVSSGISSITASYIDPTSSIQDQLNDRLSFSSAISPSNGDILYFTSGAWANLPVDADGKVLTLSSGLPSWQNGISNGIPTGGTANQYLNKVDSTDYNVQWSSLTLSKVTDVTSSPADLNTLLGANAAGLTPAKIVLLSTITSDIQTQFSNKLNRSLAYNAIFTGNAANLAAELPAGADDQVLTIIAGVPQWVDPTPPGNVSGVAPSVDNAIARWNGTLADSIQNSLVIIDDSGNVSGVTTLSTGTTSILNQATLKLYETGSTNYVGLRASAVMAADYTITLPAAAPSANTYLKYDGANYVWATGGSGAIAFTNLSDVPTSYVGESLKSVRVDVGETALEFYTPTNPTITLSGDITGTGTTAITTTIGTNKVVNTMIRQSSGLSVIGRNANTTGNVADITAASDYQILRRSGTTIGFGSIDLSQSTAVGSSILAIANGGTNLSALGTANQLLRVNSGATALEYFSPTYISGNESITISGDGSGTGSTAITLTIGANKILDSMIRQSTGLSILGRASNSTGDIADITAGSDNYVLRRSGTSIAFGTIDNAGLTNSSIALATGTSGTDVTWGSTPVSLGGTATLNIPSASATARGVISTGSQTIAGAKTFTSSPIVSAGGFTNTLSSTAVDFGNSMILGRQTAANNFLYSSIRMQIPTITFTASGATADTNAPIISTSGLGLTLTTNATNASSTTYNNFTVSGTLNPAGNTSHTFASISSTFSPSNNTSNSIKSLSITGTINATGAGNYTVYGLIYAPTESSMTNVTHYGIVSTSSTGKSGIGTSTPTAMWDVAASTTTRASLRIRPGTAPTSPNVGDCWFDGTNLKFYDGIATRTVTWI